MPCGIIGLPGVGSAIVSFLDLVPWSSMALDNRCSSGFEDCQPRSLKAFEVQKPPIQQSFALAAAARGLFVNASRPPRPGVSGPWGPLSGAGSETKKL